MQLRNFVGGTWTGPSGAQIHRIINPADGRTEIAELRYSTASDVAEAVKAAKAALPAWSDTPVVERCRILFHAKERLEQGREELARLIVSENGKTHREALGELRRGLEVVEFATGMPSLARGDFVEQIAPGIDGYICREPVGVVAGACPFNFPAMIPLWMVPVALACGNTFVLKPSEKCPLAATRLAHILEQSGLPGGVLNLIHGDGETFQALIGEPDIAAISFVGSTPAAERVWRAGTQAGKRVQALGGAKNYIIILPDADPAATAEAVVGSSFGCAGERCMASSVAVLVGESGAMLEAIVEAAKGLRLGDGREPATQMGPVLNAAHKKRVEEYVTTGLAEGARLILDGREPAVEGLPHGHFLGPTIFDRVTPGMRIATEEIFGPVLCVLRAANLDEAIDLANGSPYGNGASLFTASGGAARAFRRRIECGMIGINVGVPVPMAFFSFGGRKRSFFGDLRAYGPDSVEFYTRKKAVIERWFGKEY